MDDGMSEREILELTRCESCSQHRTVALLRERVAELEDGIRQHREAGIESNPLLAAEDHDHRLWALLDTPADQGDDL